MIYIAFRMAAVHLKNYFKLIAFYLSNYDCYYCLSFAAINAKYINFETQRAIGTY